MIRDGSIRVKAPLTIAATLLVGVAAFGALAYDAVSRSIVATAEVRMSGLASQIVTPTAATTARERRAHELAGDAVFKAALVSPTTANLAAARAVLLSWGRDTGVLVNAELRDSTGKTVVTISGRSGYGREIPGRLDDSVATGVLFARGDSVLSEFGAPVREGARVIGRISQVRSTLTGATATLQRTREVLGLSPDVAFLLGNPDGSLWVDMTKRIEVPAKPVKGTVHYVRDGVPRMAVMTPYVTAPLYFALEAPEATLRAPARRLLVAFIMLGAIVVAVGTAIGWWMSSGVTGALTRLTDAAEQIAKGNLSHPELPSVRGDELGRLAASFNQMRDSVRSAHASLESQVAARTEELRTAQEALVRKERLATLGQLSSSVGHELRNPLGVMTNAVYFLEMTLSEAPAKVREYLGILRTQIRMSEKIVADLLDFARIRPAQRARIVVNDLVSEQLARVTVPATVMVNRDGIDRAAAIYVDSIQVGQILLNLLTNAVQAMDEKGGTLTLRTRPNGTMMHLDITDTGPGIPRENLERVFEPLFTTKARGIGLGLSVSRSLAQGNGGSLAAASDPGKGTTFTLTLPIGNN